MSSPLPRHSEANTAEQPTRSQRIAARIERLSPDLRDTIVAGRDFVLSKQNRDGSWSGDTPPSLRTTAEFVAMSAWFGLESNEPARACIDWMRDAWEDSAVRSLLDISTLTLIRLAVHVCGESRQSRLSRELDALIQRRGSYRRADSVARIYLAIFNQISFAECDPLPPELMLLPKWTAASLHQQDRWSRAIRVPLCILTALQPRKVSVSPIGKPPSESHRLRKRPGPFMGMTLAQRICISALQLIESLGITGVRTWALRSAQRWILTRVSALSGVAGSMSATALSAIALNCLGYERTSPAVTRCFDSLQSCLHEGGGVAANFVPHFETALAISGLADVGISTAAAAVDRAVETILSQEVVRQGDWPDIVNVEPGGWSSEPDNDHYPDVACTAAMLVALRTHCATSPAASLVTDDSMVAMIRANKLHSAQQRIALLDRVTAASRRARRWLIALQRPNGSWSALNTASNWHATADCDQRSLAAAITGLVLQALGQWEMRAGQTTVDRAITYLREMQISDGLWLGGEARDLYATWMALDGLLAVGVSANDACIRKANRALTSRQNPDGGFGRDGHSTVVDTAWALLALVASQPSAAADPQTVDRTAEWLLYHQLPAGDWHHDDPSQFTLGPLAISRTSCTIYALLAVSRWALAKTESRSAT